MCLLEQRSVWQLNIKMVSLVTAPDLVNFQAFCYTENWIWLEFYNLSFCDWKWLNNIKIPNWYYSIQIDASMLKILWLHSHHWRNMLKTKEIGTNRLGLQNLVSMNNRKKTSLVFRTNSSPLGRWLRKNLFVVTMIWKSQNKWTGFLKVAVITVSQKCLKLTKRFGLLIHAERLLILTLILFCFVLF